MSDGTNSTLPLAFSCDVTHADPDTPDFVTADQVPGLIETGVQNGGIRDLKKFNREFRTSDLTMPDGRELEFWVFKDDDSGNVFPSQEIRVTEGDLVQVRMKARKGVHTIHHHGVEPDAFNDGVGHTSFEAGEYTYQWQAHHAGTYFYHCHVNTTLHVQMGLFGPLIIEPEPNPAGTKRLFADGPEYVHERVWAAYAADPRWHDMNHAAGLCGEDLGLNKFEPKYFLINDRAQKNGAISPQEVAGTQPPPPRPPITDENVAIIAAKGEPVLIRVIQAQYFPITIQFGDISAPLTAEIWGSDGRPLRETWAYRGEDEEGTLVRGKDSVFEMSPAERWDFLLNTEETPVATGVYPISILYSHWITGEPVGVVVTQLTIKAS